MGYCTYFADGGNIRQWWEGGWGSLQNTASLDTSEKLEFERFSVQLKFQDGVECDKIWKKNLFIDKRILVQELTGV